MDGWAFILLGEDEQQISMLYEELRDLLIHICDNKTHYFGGMGRSVHRIRDLQQSYLDANKAFSLRFFESWDQFLSYDDVRYIKDQIGNRINVSELNLEKLDRKLLEDFLKRCTLHDVDEFVESYFTGFGAEAMRSTLFRNYIIMDGFSAIMKFFKTLQYPKEVIDSRFMSLNSVMNQLESVEDCCEFYKSILKEAIELRNKSSQNRYYGLIKQAKEYMHLHFATSDLTLDKVASTVNVSPNYFSSLFNQKTGMTFIEYLTNIRMEKAKEYLRCSCRKITEIGFLVGYQDSHYFSYIFKKTQNCTPSEYRLRGKGEA